MLLNSSEKNKDTELKAWTHGGYCYFERSLRSLTQKREVRWVTELRDSEIGNFIGKEGARTLTMFCPLRI